ncbi:cell surface protein [Lactiplantibacillus paraplantarum]|uniref:cell surface protein n=1 Tax=Lactiplantibacillus paraplantarum TaxID=60520 RepID=UPI00148AF3AF|nr:cell surface protein [Lactiplantibacillus paraplantarum]QJU51283.1 hypothetical protein CK401_02187 [Lactiplantibacillus paraplantarum]UKB40763.1 cell surface protein [Lactiplantibacillus paraplantarum]
MRNGRIGWLLTIGLSVVWLLTFASISGMAATLTDKMTDVKSNAAFEDKSTGAVLGSISDGGLSSYPKLGAVTANYADNGRITNQTTQISVTMTGTISLRLAKYEMSSVYYDIMKNPVNTYTGITLLTKTPASIGSGNSVTISSANRAQTLSVNLKDIKNSLPIYIGFRVFVDGQDSTHYVGKFNVQALAPQITGTLYSTDTVIKGTGTPGNTISSNVNGVTTTVGSDGNYTLNLGTALGSLSSVTVTEVDEVTGDKGTATAAVTLKKLNITSTKTAIDIYPGDFDNLNSDSAVVAWIVKQAGIVATNPDSATDTMTYAAKETGLASQLSSLAVGGSMTVNIYAKGSLGLQSDAKAITVTMRDGTLKLESLPSSMTFGTLTVPFKETLYQPTNSWNVIVNDTRKTGSRWYLRATATAMKSSTRALSGNLIYLNGGSKQVLTNASVTVGTGTKVAGTSSTNVTNAWSANKGILLDVQPSVQVDSYSGTVNWTLQDTP